MLLSSLCYPSSCALVTKLISVKHYQCSSSAYYQSIYIVAHDCEVDIADVCGALPRPG